MEFKIVAVEPAEDVSPATQAYGFVQYSLLTAMGEFARRMEEMENEGVHAAEIALFTQDKMSKIIHLSNQFINVCRKTSAYISAGSTEEEPCLICKKNPPRSAGPGELADVCVECLVKAWS